MHIHPFDSDRSKSDYHSGRKRILLLQLPNVSAGYRLEIYIVLFRFFLFYLLWHYRPGAVKVWWMKICVNINLQIINFFNPISSYCMDIIMMTTLSNMYFVQRIGLEKDKWRGKGGGQGCSFNFIGNCLRDWKETGSYIISTVLP